MSYSDSDDEYGCVRYTKPPVVCQRMEFKWHVFIGLLTVGILVILLSMNLGGFDFNKLYLQIQAFIARHALDYLRVFGATFIITAICYVLICLGQNMTDTGDPR